MLFVRPDRLTKPLYVVCTVFNPARYRNRWRHYKDFELHVQQAGAHLLTVEVAFGQREFVLTTPDHPLHLQLRTHSELWLKENALNLGIQRLPMDWEYVAWVDADVVFARPDWADETLHQLQHYDIVQMWSEAVDLSPTHQILQTHQSFVYSYQHDEPEIDGDIGVYGKLRPKTRHYTWHPGFAWAARREALDALGGLLDFAILGSADMHMAKAFLGRVDGSAHPGVSAPYRQGLHEWQARALRHIKGNIGYVDGLLMHAHHGPKTARRYRERWQILVDHQFNPVTDIKRDTQGLWQLDTDETARSQGLRDDIRRYFHERDEDSTAT